MRNKLLLMALALALFSCTEDRDIPKITAPQNDDYQLVHYWNFNNSSTDDALVAPTYTNGGGKLTYLGSYFDAVDEGTDINVRNADEAGGALRLRNPSGDLILDLPTTGFKDVAFTFATTRTSNGPQVQSISYTTDGTNYVTTGIANPAVGVTEQYVLQQFDFKDITAADNNANFKIKISYTVNADLDSGNSRYDNIVLEGIATDATGGGSDDGGTDPTPEFELFQYWNFNDATTETTLTTPNIGNGTLVYSGSYIDETDEATDMNARNGDVAGYAYRLRNPSGNLIISIPTTGHKDIVLNYATMRTGSGSQTQTISYTTDGINYVTTGITSAYTVGTAFALIPIDFSAIPAANNNPNFKVKVVFDAASSTAASGNNRIDNLTVEGNTL